MIIYYFAMMVCFGGHESLEVAEFLRFLWWLPFGNVVTVASLFDIFNEAGNPHFHVNLNVGNELKKKKDPTNKYGC